MLLRSLFVAALLPCALAAGAAAAQSPAPAVRTATALTADERTQIQELRCQGKAADAVALLAEHPAVKEGDARATALYGIALREAGRSEEAGNLVPLYYGVYQGKIPEVFLLCAYFALEKEDWARAESYFLRASAVSRDLVEVQFGIAATRAIQRPIREMVDQVLAFQSRSAELPAGLFQRLASRACLRTAEALLGDGAKNAEAIGVLDLGLGLDPANEALHVALAGALVEAGQAERASSVLKRIQAEFPTRMADALYFEARLLEASGQADAALAKANDALIVDRSHLATLELAAKLAHAAGKGDETRLFADRLIGLDQHNLVGHDVLADLLEQRGGAAENAADKMNYLKLAAEHSKQYSMTKPLDLRAAERWVRIVAQLGKAGEDDLGAATQVRDVAKRTADLRAAKKQ